MKYQIVVYTTEAEFLRYNGGNKETGFETREECIKIAKWLMKSNYAVKVQSDDIEFIGIFSLNNFVGNQINGMTIHPFSSEEVTKFLSMTKEELKVEIANRVMDITQLDGHSSYRDRREITLNEEIQGLQKIVKNKFGSLQI